MTFFCCIFRQAYLLLVNILEHPLAVKIPYRVDVEHVN